MTDKNTIARPGQRVGGPTRRWLGRAALATSLVGLVTGCSPAAAPSAPATSSPATPAAPVSSPSSAAASASVPSPVPSLAAAASPAASPGTLATLNMSFVSESATETWRHLAQDTGIFARNGLEVNDNQIANIGAAVSAVVSGQIDVAEVGGPPALTAAAAGADVVVITVLTPVWDFRLMGPTSIQSVSDLKGKTIGVAGAVGSGSPAELAVRAVLPKYGLDPDTDVSFFSVSTPDDRLPALLSGQIDAIPLTPPDDLQASQAGFHQIVDIAQEQLPGDVQGFVTTRAWLSAHPDVAQRLVDSLTESEVILHNNKDQAIAEIQKYVSYTDPTAYEEAWDYFYGNSVLTPILQYPRVEQFTFPQQVLGKTNPQIAQYDLTRLIDPSFVQSAADRGLDKS